MSGGTNGSILFKFNFLPRKINLLRGQTKYGVFSTSTFIPPSLASSKTDWFSWLIKVTTGFWAVDPRLFTGPALIMLGALERNVGKQNPTAEKPLKWLCEEADARSSRICVCLVLVRLLLFYFPIPTRRPSSLTVATCLSATVAAAAAESKTNSFATNASCCLVDGPSPPGPTCRNHCTRWTTYTHTQTFENGTCQYARRSFLRRLRGSSLPNKWPLISVRGWWVVKARPRWPRG